MPKYMYTAVALLVLLLVPVFVLFPSRSAEPDAPTTWDVVGEDWMVGMDTPFWDSLLSGSFSQTIEGYVQKNFPLRDRLRGIGINIRYWGGSREQNGVLIGQNQLIKNIDPPTDGIVEKNIDAVARFAEYLRDVNKPFYFTLIPTAGGILHHQLPRNVQVFDQRHFIEDMYGQLTGKANVVNTYLPLNTNRTQYIFYRTENNLTAHGGYYVYEALVKRMGISEKPSYNSFNIDYASHTFVGDLYSSSPYGNVQPDVLMLLRYSRHVRSYVVTHKGPEGEKIYQTLYPAPAEGKKPDMNLFLGGTSAVMDIETDAPIARQLLVFGDKTALAYLPLLANHYCRITFVDLFYDTTAYSDIDPEEYDQILMAYSVESFSSPLSMPARITQFIMTP